MKKTPSQLGSLIVLEGPDGVGKTSLSNRIAEHFDGTPDRFIQVSFPGLEPGSLGNLVYEIHHDPQRYGLSSVNEFSNQMLHVAAHIDSLDRIVSPALEKGTNVLLDRFWWSTWVYGVVDRLKRTSLKKLVDLERGFWKRFPPSAVFLVSRDTPIDRDVDLKKWSALSHEYDVLAEKERQYYSVFRVPNDGSLDELCSSVLDATTSVLTDRKRLFTNLDPTLSESGSARAPGLTGKFREAPQVLTSHIHPAKPTIVFDTYWKFAAERQRIFFKKQQGEPAPWTADPVLLRHKFTNAYRASDRVSQFLIKDVIYNDELPSSNKEVFFRIILFKLFNKIDTWKLLQKEFGEITYESFEPEAYDRALTQAASEGRTIYSGAYIMPSGGKNFGLSMKHRTHLKLLNMMMEDDLDDKIASCTRMQRGFELLRSYPSVGDFLAYQFIVDINYSEITNFRENEFVVPGPGALDGIRKCFTDRGGLTPTELIRFVADIQQAEFDRLGLDFQTLWGRPLQLIDCQNLFCEVDKYARVMHPEISGITGRTRIKQMYRQTVGPIEFWYPPKWGINDAISSEKAKRARSK